MSTPDQLEHALFRYLDGCVSKESALRACAVIAPLLVDRPTIVFLELIARASDHSAGLFLLAELATHWEQTFLAIRRLKVREHLFILGLVLAYPARYKTLIKTMPCSMFNCLLFYISSHYDSFKENVIHHIGLMVKFRETRAIVIEAKPAHVLFDINRPISTHRVVQLINRAITS